LGLLGLPEYSDRFEASDFDLDVAEPTCEDWVSMGGRRAPLAAGDGTRLAVRIAMHAGPVVTADFGEVFGDTADLVARAQVRPGPIRR
jgi:class 3 adenylate cyclase